MISSTREASWWKITLSGVVCKKKPIQVNQSTKDKQKESQSLTKSAVAAVPVIFLCRSLISTSLLSASSTLYSCVIKDQLGPYFLYPSSMALFSSTVKHLYLQTGLRPTSSERGIKALNKQNPTSTILYRLQNLDQ